MEVVDDGIMKFDHTSANFNTMNEALGLFRSDDVPSVTQLAAIMHTFPVMSDAVLDFVTENSPEDINKLVDLLVERLAASLWDESTDCLLPHAMSSTYSKRSDEAKRLCETLTLVRQYCNTHSTVIDEYRNDMLRFGMVGDVDRIEFDAKVSNFVFYDAIIRMSGSDALFRIPFEELIAYGKAFNQFMARASESDLKRPSVKRIVVEYIYATQRFITTMSGGDYYAKQHAIKAIQRRMDVEGDRGADDIDSIIEGSEVRDVLAALVIEEESVSNMVDALRSFYAVDTVIPSGKKVLKEVFIDHFEEWQHLFAAVDQKILNKVKLLTSMTGE